MSSLAASRADNFYFPPDWRPEYGGISKFAGSKGANQYEQYGIIRFELPFDAWCNKCGCHMCKGLRFNAKKDKAGNYFSTTIWAFTTKCYDCNEKFVIKTNPQLGTYDFVEGLRKKEEDFVPDADDSIIQATDDVTRQQLATNPMFALQHENEDKARALSMSERMNSLIDLREERFQRDYDGNAALRQRNREKKRKAADMLAAGRAHGLAIALVDENPEDVALARQLASGKNSTGNHSLAFKISERRKLVDIQSASIFDGAEKQQQRLSSSTETGKRLSATKNAMKKQAVQRIDVRNIKLHDGIDSHAEVKPAFTATRLKKYDKSMADVSTSTTESDNPSQVSDNKIPKGAVFDLVCSYGDDSEDTVE